MSEFQVVFIFRSRFGTKVYCPGERRHPLSPVGVYSRTLEATPLRQILVSFANDYGIILGHFRTFENFIQPTQLLDRRDVEVQS